MAKTIRDVTRCRHCPLKSLPAFRKTTASELEFIEQFKSGEFVAEAGTTILLEGSDSPHLFTVLAGWGYRYKSLDDGRMQILNFVLPGDFLGLQGTMLNGVQHSLESLTPMTLCVFPRDKLWNLYANHPSLAYDLTWLASRSERILDEHLLTIGRRSASERVAFILLDVFRRARGRGLTQGNKLRLPLTQQHLADTLGLSLVHTNRTLKGLVLRKLFRWRVGVLEMLDEDAMAELAEHTEEREAVRPLI